MKKFFKFSLMALFIISMLAVTSCKSDDEPEAVVRDADELSQELATQMEREIEEVQADDNRLERHGLEIVEIDGENVFRFIETRQISVVAWNRADDRMPHISQSIWADWIREEVLRIHNIEVTYVEVPRWEEVDTMANLLNIGEAPDVSFTFEYPPVEALAGMGGILDLTPLIIENADLFPNFYNLQGANNIWYNRRPDTGENWGFAVRHYNNALRIGTFVRGDWLDTLGMQPPTTRQEFEDMLIAFRDNAELLLGGDASQMIPYRLTRDVGWTGDPIITSFIPSGITDREWFIYGFDDRRFTQPGIKEGVRVLNRWYNEGLIWQDFSLHDNNDTTGDDLMMLGFVGAFSGNWDYPFRPRPGIITNLHTQVGEHAYFIPVACFENDAGEIRLQVPDGTDRTIFFPHTNTEPIASLLYLDFISRPTTYEFLMFGFEDIHYVIEDGVYRQISMDDVPDEYVIPSLRNYDLLPTFNGTPPLNTPGFLSFFQSFDGIDPQLVADAINIAITYHWVGPRAVTRTIVAEGRGGGLLGVDGESNGVLNRAINASIADFDNVFDAGYADYLAAGGQAIIDERNAAWIETYGDVDWLPDN